MLEKNNARPRSPVPKFMSLNVLIFPFDEMEHDVTKWASGRACQHLNWWSCCGEKPWGLMKCSRGRLQKGGGEFSRHTHWQESEGWKEVQGRADLQYCMCSNSGHVYTEESTMVFSKDHHSSVRHYGHPQWLRVHFNSSSSLFLSVSLIFSLTLPLSLGRNSVEFSAQSCVCCLKGVSHIPHQCWLQRRGPRFITNTRSVPYQICCSPMNSLTKTQWH